MEAVVAECSKKKLREDLKLKRSQFVEFRAEQLDHINAEIHENIQSLLGLLKKGDDLLVASYRSFGSEVGLDPLHDQLEQNYRLCYPRVSDSGLQFYEMKNLNSFEKSSWGVMEPSVASTSVSAKAIDVLLIPGLGFSRKGNRMGYGQGHYDRVLSLNSGIKVGVAYSAQIIDEDDVFEAHDVSMDYVVTENYILKIVKEV